MPQRLDNAKQRQDTSGNINSQLWVLQVVGSNPAAPTNSSRSGYPIGISVISPAADFRPTSFPKTNQARRVSNTPDFNSASSAGRSDQ